MGRKAYSVFTCSCGERCVMVPHQKGLRLAPITVNCYDDGNVALTATIHDGKVIEVYRIVPEAEREADPKPRLLNHWGNCPDAASFRR